MSLYIQSWQQLSLDVKNLAEEENKLGKIVEDLYNQSPYEPNETELRKVYSQYRAIHKKYAELAAVDNLEALKRGIFLQWYAMSEPNWLTGVSNLDPQIEINIIQTLNDKILSSSLDEKS